MLLPLPVQNNIAGIASHRAWHRVTQGKIAVKEHVESGNQKFEVRSNNDDLGINKEQIIYVDEYEIKYKHN